MHLACFLSRGVLICEATPQATANGFGLVSQEHVFRVCDQPHPVMVASIVKSCIEANIDAAYRGMKVRCMKGCGVCLPLACCGFTAGW